MKLNGKRMMSALLAGVMMVFAAPGVSAAAATTASKTYSVHVKSDQVQLIKGGKVTNTYDLYDKDITLTSDKSHELYVQFATSKSKTTNVTLGRQKTLSISGSIDTLAIRSALPNDIKVTVEKGSSIQKLLHYGRNNLIVNGSLQLLSIYDTSLTSITSSGKAYRVQLRDSDCQLKASGKVTVLEQVSGARASGIGVDSLDPLIRDKNSSEWGTSKSTSTLTLRSETLYAYEGETLWELEHDLDSAVRAYDGLGNRISGDVEFTTSESTVLNRTRTVKYTFYPDNHRFKNTSGTIRVEVSRKPAPNPTPSDLTVFTSASNISTHLFPDMRLGALDSDLQWAASAWDSRGIPVIGTAQWRYPTQRVASSGSYDYIFYPSDSRYRSATGTVYIDVQDIDWGDVDIGQGAYPTGGIGTGAVPVVGGIGTGAVPMS